MTFLIGLYAVIAFYVLTLAIIFTTVEIILHIRTKTPFSDGEELRLLHILFGSAMILALLFLISFIKI